MASYGTQSYLLGVSLETNFQSEESSAKVGFDAQLAVSAFISSDVRIEIGNGKGQRKYSAILLLL